MQRSLMRLHLYKTILFFGWMLSAFTLYGAPTLITGELTTIIENEAELKRNLPDHVLALALSEYIENTLNQKNKQDQFAKVIWNIRDFVAAYAVEKLTIEENKISYRIQVKWDESWNSLLNSPQSQTQLSQPTPYWITIDSKLSALHQRRPIDIFRALETQILHANTTYALQKLFIPALPIETMLQPESIHTVCNQLDASGFFHLKYAHKNKTEITQDISYVTCSTTANLSQPKIEKGISIHKELPLPVSVLLQDNPASVLHKSWRPLFTQDLPTLQRPKKYFVRLNVKSDYLSWKKQYEVLSENLTQMDFIDSVSLYSLASEQKTVQLHVKHLTEAGQLKLTQGIVSFCKNQYNTCEVSLENSVHQALWNVQTP
jgi:hypothetical protein